MSRVLVIEKRGCQFKKLHNSDWQLSVCGFLYICGFGHLWLINDYSDISLYNMYQNNTIYIM